MITLSSYKPEPELEIFNVVSLSNNEKAVYSRLVSSLKSKYFSNAGKMVRMQWWAYLLMLMVYICYLLIGAAVFQTGVRILSLALEITLRKKFFL